VCFGGEMNNRLGKRYLGGRKEEDFEDRNEKIFEYF
jgi:hypothetical protein